MLASTLLAQITAARAFLFVVAASVADLAVLRPSRRAVVAVVSVLLPGLVVLAASLTINPSSGYIVEVLLRSFDAGVLATTESSNAALAVGQSLAATGADAYGVSPVSWYGL